MPLPDIVRVKLSSEAAEYVALTPVVTRDLPFLELLEHVLGATGPDIAHAREILKRGSLVSGASRFRWQGWECDELDLQAALTLLPKPDPTRPFTSSQCHRAILTGPAIRLELPREAAAQTRLFRRRSFWQSLMEAAANPAYVTYLYKEHSDHYRVELPPDARIRLKEEAALLKFDGLTAHIRRAPFERLELLVSR